MDTFRVPQLDGRVTPGTLPVLGGDLLAIFLFIVAGLLQHNTAGRLMDIVYFADTVGPFLIGWAIAATIMGVYRVPYDNPTRSAARGGAAWILSALIGQGLRATPLFHGGVTASFVAVSVVVGGTLIVVWRVGYGLVGSAIAR